MNGVAGVAAAARTTATRRRFTAEHKVRIVAEAGKCTERGAIGRLLEREGLFASRLSAWRKQAREGALRALGGKRGPKPRPAEEKRWREEVRRLQRENAGLRRRLLAADAVAERQAKRCGSAEDKAPAWEEVAKIVNDLAGEVGIAPACEALGVCRSTYYRRRAPRSGSPRPRPAPPRALSAAERKDVFDVLCSERFVDRSPAEVFATLLDEGVYLCSERTMYRVLAENRAVRERRPQRSHPHHPKPEVAARGPNQAWSWDITRLPGAAKGTFHYLYVVLDIYSRYVAGWMVADRESAVSSDNQDENVATIKVRTRGRDATSARTMAVAGRRGKWERGGRVSGTAGMRRPCSADSGVFHRPGAASVASRDGAVEGGFSEG